MKRLNKYLLALAAVVLVPCTLHAIQKQSVIDHRTKVISPSELVKNHNEAILLITFGSTHQEAHDTFREIRKTFTDAFPQKDIFMAFTSKICMKRWASKSGEQYYAPDKWLEEMGKKGYKKIFIQSLHIIPGFEYGLIVNKYVPDFEKKYPNCKVVVGEPLLSNDQDIATVGDAIYKEYEKELKHNEALVLMGHGNDTDSFPEANSQYDRLNAYLQKKNKLIVIGTVDYKSLLFESVADYLSKNAVPGTTINLAPLMSIAGDHAKNDMAAPYDPKEPAENQSWATQLEALGYKTRCHLRGLADNKSIVQVWINHLRSKIIAVR